MFNAKEKKMNWKFWKPVDVAVPPVEEKPSTKMGEVEVEDWLVEFHCKTDEGQYLKVFTKAFIGEAVYRPSWAYREDGVYLQDVEGVVSNFFINWKSNGVVLFKDQNTFVRYEDFVDATLTKSPRTISVRMKCPKPQ